jgi:hypothetical protein
VFQQTHTDHVVKMKGLKTSMTVDDMSEKGTGPRRSCSSSITADSQCCHKPYAHSAKTVYVFSLLSHVIHVDGVL